VSNWIYFGCGKSGTTGHYLLDRYGHSIRMDHPLYRRIDKFDGAFAPLSRVPYIASMTRLGGLGVSALSWWDNSVDTRPGSNSIVYIPSLTTPPDRALEAAKQVMPWVFDRLPRALALMGDA
jgi:hypothetical protein